MILLLKRISRQLGNKNKIKQSSVSIYQNKEFYNQLHSQRLVIKPNTELPSSFKRNILITSALPYVNNKPHLGNIIGAVLSADVYARYCRLMGYNVLFISGTDEYGTATEVKALQEGITPKEICDKYHQVHKNIYEWFDISFDYFGRTSKPIHSKITQEIFQQIDKKGLFKQKSSIQLYCQNCDLFLADRFVNGKCKQCGSFTRGDQCQSCSTIFNNLSQQIQDIQCSICKNSPKPTQTTHLYLQLQKQVSQLKKWLFEENGIQNWSNNAKGVTKGWFSLPFQDRCITRDLKWGVQVPLAGFQKKVFYVWFQAPLGYISITADFLGDNYKNWWIKDQKIKVQLNQFMGKDNILFHSIICPASLLGCDSKWVLPSKISATQYLMYQGGKFSKSNNIGVFGDQCQKTGLLSEYWRYYLLRNRPQTFDSEFTWDDFSQKCNKQLLNNIGNLIHRVLKYSFNTFGKQIITLKQQDLTQEQLFLIKQLQNKIKKFNQQMQNIQIFRGINSILQISNTINSYIAKTQFWKNIRKKTILAFLQRIIKIYSVIISPFLPTLTAKINYLLGCDNRIQQGQLQSFSNLKFVILYCQFKSSGLRQPIPLIKEITQLDIKQFRQKFGSHKS